MKKMLSLAAFGLGLVLYLVPAWAEVTAPAVPKTGKTLGAFVPTGWKILKQAEGDLNKDSLPDTVLILASGVEDGDSEDRFDAPRPLLLLLKQTDGGYSLAGNYSNVVLCKMCGGVFGDPLEDLRIDRGTVVIKHYGGSSDRWGFTHKYRFQDGDWYLIGETDLSHNSFTPLRDVTDHNLLTGDIVEEKTDKHGQKTIKKSKVPKAPLKKMGEVELPM